MNTAKYEQRLGARLRELTERMVTIEDRLDDPVDPDPEERSVEREDDETLQSLGSAAAGEVRQIRAALARIADGTFGTCVACSAKISGQRLDIVPHAAKCRRCI